MPATSPRFRWSRVATLLIVAFLVTGCGEVEMHHLEMRKGRAYLKKAFKPYSGSVKSYYPAKEGEDRQLYMEGLFDDGLRDGTWITYRADGWRIEDKYIFGRRNGVIKTFDAKSKVRKEENFFNGRLHGASTYKDSKGGVERNLYFDQGAQISYPHPKAKVEFEAKVKEGPSDDLLRQ
uniref:MORN variant repeat protein n=1 Tax=Magnetococcus massalia (strain MO-1) TaxID=451514 RepID=A0A1S7LMJ1_MAGMO|nr:Conserved protein of unknown function [Candidatus Magnetococcus massalia]